MIVFLLYSPSDSLITYILISQLYSVRSTFIFHIRLMIVSNYNSITIHNEAYNNHMHTSDITNNHIHIPKIINNYIHTPDVIINRMHILDVINYHSHIPDVISHHIHIPNVIIIYSCILLNDQVKIKTSNLCQAHFNKNNNNTPLRSLLFQPGPFLWYIK